MGIFNRLFRKTKEDFEREQKIELEMARGEVIFREEILWVMTQKDLIVRRVKDVLLRSGFILEVEITILLDNNDIRVTASMEGEPVYMRNNPLMKFNYDELIGPELEQYRNSIRREMKLKQLGL